MPLPAGAPVISLCEGGTPLVESGWLSELTGCRVLLKFDGGNPTGSFKDRGMTMAISMAAHEGARAVICASTGNTSDDSETPADIDAAFQAGPWDWIG